MDKEGLQRFFLGLKNKFAAKSHTHAIADVTDLQTTLNGKAASSHTHAISAITNLQSTLDGKAATSHTHAISDVTNLQNTLNGKASSTHSHVISDITNLQSTLDGKASSSHTHAISAITNLQSELDLRVVGKSLSASIDMNVRSTTSYTLSAVARYYQTTIYRVKVYKSTGSYGWVSYNIYLPSGGSYYVEDISYANTGSGSIETTLSLSKGSTYSGGSTAATGRVYNNVDEVYTTITVAIKKVL
ncbi:MAG: hypothetical protein ACI4NM_10840 [Bullifex sp.]